MFSFIVKGAFSVFALAMVLHLAGRLLDAGEQMQGIDSAAIAQVCSPSLAKTATFCAGHVARD
mgnify:CR=1 FL=1